MYQRLTASKLPLSSVISYHRMRPSLRAQGWSKDPRCRVFAEYTRLESGPPHWTSRCLPSFVLLGTPKSGTTSLFNWVLQHPDVRAPVRKELHFWAPVLTPEKNCADRESCSIFSVKNSDGKTVQHANWPLSKLVAGRMLTSYLNLFPRVDPRTYLITGEASPAYLYSPSVALFLESMLSTHMKLLVLLRDPADRAFSEFKNKRDLMVKGAPKATAWVNGHAKFSQLVNELSRSAIRCSPVELYTACEPCMRFAVSSRLAENVANANASNASAGSQSAHCKVPPIIWQSWYHLFIKRYMDQHGPRLLIEFSDDLFDGAGALMHRVGDFLGLPSFNFSTNVAYNTEKRRGAYIVQAGGKNKSRVAGNIADGNAADAKSAATSRSHTSQQHMAVVERLMRHSVGELQQIFLQGQWAAPKQQWRRQLPAKWVKRYRI